MKLLRSRKLLKKPKQIESRQGKIFRQLRHIWSEIFRRKVFIFNLIVLLATCGYMVKYLIDREEQKEQERIEQIEVEKEGNRLRDIFFNNVFKEEMEEQRQQEEEEERRKEAIAAATSQEEDAAEEVSADEQTESQVVEQTQEEEIQEMVSTQEIIEQIEEENSQEWQLYENKTYKYSIEYPPNWFTDRETGSSSWLAYITSYDPASYKRDETPGMRIEVLVQDNVRNLSLDEWVAEGHKYYGEPVSSQKTTVASQEAHREKVNVPNSAVNIYFIYDNRIYTITFTGGNIDDDNNVKIFNYIVSKMKLL